MIDRLLCKAKEEGTGKWVYGYYVFQPSAGGSADMIFTPAPNPDESNKVYFVDQKTVCQITPFVDNNGRRLYEGDVIKFLAGVSYDKASTGVIKLDLFSGGLIVDESPFGFECIWSGSVGTGSCVYVRNIHDGEGR